MATLTRPSARKKRKNSNPAISTCSEVPGAATSTSKQSSTRQLLRGTPEKSPRASYSQTFFDCKRRRLDDDDEVAPPPSSPPPSQSNSIAAMYSFPSIAKANGHEVIDLTTDASPRTPRSRRISVGLKTDPFASPKDAPRIKVKNLRSPKADSQEFCRKTLGQLDAALTAIFDKRRPALSNEELYRGAENLCKLGKAEDTSRLLFQKIEDNVSGVLKQSLVTRCANKSNTEVLQNVLEEWKLFSEQLLLVRSIFYYVDRAHLLQNKSPSINETSIRVFKKHVFENSALKVGILDGACDMLKAERTGGTLDRSLFADAVKMFHELVVYSLDFEPKMLAQSQDYIAAWSEREVEKPLPEYVRLCFRFIDDEVDRCARFDLDTTTRRSLLILLEHHLIERKEQEYLTSEQPVAEILNSDEATATEDLGKLYALLQRRRLETKLKPAFCRWVDETGTAIIFDDKEEEHMVVRLLELKRKLDNIWRVAFQRDAPLGQGMRESFELFINKSKKSKGTWDTDNAKAGEMIAKYVDMLLKAGAKAIPTTLTASKAKAADEEEGGEDNEDLDEDSVVNTQLDQVLDLFRFVHGKAVFEAFYKKDLARRLLMGRSASSDAERSMLTRLANECGSGFTTNLEQMFKDIELSREELGGYKSRMESNDRKAGVDLNVNILSASAWPTYPDIPVTIPNEVKKALDSFEGHYYQKHSGRKLSWKHALAHSVMRARYPKGSKEIVVSCFQAVVMLLFNKVSEDEALSYDHLKAESGLSDAELKRTLQSLACAKLRPLTKIPKGREVNDTDKFSINQSFAHEKYRVKINAIQLKETKEENKETHVRVAADRQFETQAAIVRIMKSRKHITHAELVAEVISATRTRGTLNVPEIKKNIDKLIDKDYMERAENNSYNYLA